MSVVYLLSSSNTLIPLEVLQLQNTLLNMTTSSQEYFLGQNRIYYYAVSDELLLLLENTQLNQQIINSYTIQYDSTRLFSLKFISRSGGAQELGIQQVLLSLGSSLTITDLNQINGLIYTSSNFARGALLVGNDFDTNEVIVFDSNNKLKSSNKSINALVDTGTNQVISGAKTFAGTIGLTFVSAPAGVDANNLITRNQTTGILQQSAITNDKLVLTDTEQNISGIKTFTGNVKLQNLNTNTGTISKVLIKNPVSNQIEEANVGSVIGSTSTATTFTINNIVNNVFKLLYEAFPTIPLLNGLGASISQNSYTITRFDYANSGLSNSTLALENSGSKVAVVDTGLYEFTFAFGFVHAPPTFTLTKQSGDIMVELYIDNTLVDTRYLFINATDYRNHTVVFYYRNLSNAAPKQADIRMFHNIAATTQAQGDNDILAYPVLSSATTFLSVINYGTQTRSIDILNDTTNTNALILTKTDGTMVKNNTLTPATIALKSEIPTNYATTDTVQTISGAKTFQADKVILNPITTAAATTNKLITRNQTTNVVEETNLAVSNLALLDTTQTISGAKTFSATTKIEKLYCNGLFAKDTITHSGTATWSGRYLTWTGAVRLLPINKPELALDGNIYLDIPTVGQQYTVFAATPSSSSSLVSMTSNGFDFGIGTTTTEVWTALYYKINPGQDQNDVSTNYILVNYTNTAWEPDTTWVLLAAANSDSKALKWVPGMVNIPNGASYNSAVGQLSVPKPLFSRWATTLSIPNITFTAVRFGTSSINNGSYDPTNAFISLEADTFTFKNNTSQTHQYLVSFNVMFSTNTAGLRRAELYINNTTVLASLTAVPVSGDWTMFNGQGVVVLDPTHYFIVRAQQTSGGAINVEGGTANSNIQILTLG